MRGRRNTSDSGGWRFVAQCSYPVCLRYSQGALLGSFGAGAAVSRAARVGNRVCAG